MRRLIIIAASTMALIALPASSALAQTSSCQAYNPQSCQISGVTQSLSSGGTPSTPGGTSDGGSSSSNGSSSTVNGGSLPFTGLDAALLAAGGVLLLGVGLAVRTTISARREIL